MMKNSSRKIAHAAFLLVLLSLSHLRADDVEVFAAASLTEALKEIASTYEQASGDKIIFNFAASNMLAMQIKAGAPADLFFSADEAKMDDLEKQGLLVKGTRRDLLSNTLVIVVPGDATTLTSATQLADARFRRIALGEPRSVPAGIYAKAYLQKLGIWDQVSARIIPSENVRAALAAVETGNADAGIVYKTDALHSPKVKVAYEVSLAEGPAIAYPIAQITLSKHAAAAKKFLKYLSEPDSVRTFGKYGFITKS